MIVPLQAAADETIGGLLVLRRTREPWLPKDRRCLRRLALSFAQEEWARRLDSETVRPEGGAGLEPLRSFAGGVAHEFSNLFACIEGETRLAGLGPLARPPETGLERLNSALERGRHLCRRMQSIVGEGALDRRPVSLPALVETLRSRIRHPLEGACLEVIADEGLPPILGDAPLLEEMLEAILLNALEAGPRGGCLLRIEAELSGEQIEVRIQDNGPGFPERVLQRAFEPFVTTRSPGRGLGLATVRGIARAHGGECDLVPVSSGACVRLRLPASPQVQPQPASVAEPGGWILVVDDEAGVRDTAQRLLEHLGHPVRSAASGVEALDLLSESGPSPECVLMDVSMPGLDGVETGQRMRQRYPDLPLIFMSGFCGLDPSEFNFGGDAPRFLRKPFRLSELRSALAEVFGAAAER